MYLTIVAVSGVMAKDVHVVSDTKLNVIQLESLTPDLCDQECAVVVTGIKPSVHSSDLVELYFQSSKKSGGGDIDYIHYSEKGDSAVITFCSHQGLIYIYRQSRLIFEGCSSLLPKFSTGY
jgi:hypothetical protein